MAPIELPKTIQENFNKLSILKLKNKYGKSAMQCSYPDKINVITQNTVINGFLQYTAINIKMPHIAPYKNSSICPFENLVLDISSILP